MSENTFYDDLTEGTTGMGWLLPLLVLVLVGGLILYFVKGSREKAPAVARQFLLASDTTTPEKQPVIVKTANPLRHEVELQLPDTTLMVDKGSTEYRFAMYIASPKPSGTTKPTVIPTFNLDAVNFKNTTAVLNPESSSQLQKLATIIREYPDVRIKIGCYANDTDNDAANLELSRQRAATVSSELRKRGVKENQITSTQGFGTDKPTGGNETAVHRTRVFLQVIAR